MYECAYHAQPSLSRTLHIHIVSLDYEEADAFKKRAHWEQFCMGPEHLVPVEAVEAALEGQGKGETRQLQQQAQLDSQQSKSDTKVPLSCPWCGSSAQPPKKAPKPRAKSKTKPKQWTMPALKAHMRMCEAARPVCVTERLRGRYAQSR